MRTHHNYSIAAIFVVFFSSEVAAQDIEALSTWENQDGSVLTVSDIGPGGSFTGSYVNNAQGYSCQGTPYAVSGWTNGSSISFAVNWDNSSENCNSVTGWTGYYSNGVITTKWNLASSIYLSITSGEDTFRQVQKTASDSLIPE